jgi:hypothetical protein
MAGSEKDTLNLLLQGYLVKGSSWVSSSLAHKYLTRMLMDRRENAMDTNIAATVMNKSHQWSPLRDPVIISHILDQGGNYWK